MEMGFIYSESHGYHITFCLDWLMVNLGCPIEVNLNSILPISTSVILSSSIRFLYPIFSVLTLCVKLSEHATVLYKESASQYLNKNKIFLGSHFYLYLFLIFIKHKKGSFYTCLFINQGTRNFFLCLVIKIN